MRVFLLSIVPYLLATYSAAAEPAAQLARPVAPAQSRSAPVAPKEQIDHLKAAADHLAKAGRQTEADKLREQVRSIETGQAEALLVKKEKELDSISAEVEELRKLTRRMPQISVSFQVLQFSRNRVEAAKIPNIDKLLSKNTDTINTYRVGQDSKEIVELIEKLREQDLVKILAEPTIVTVSGRTASFHLGGEVPTLQPSDNPKVTIGYARFGTELEVTPLLLGSNQLKLAIRLRIAEVDPIHTVQIGEISVPRVSSFSMETGVQMPLGQTFALGGIVKKRVEAQVDPSSAPHELHDQIETMVLITPERHDDPPRAAFTRDGTYYMPHPSPAVVTRPAKRLK